MASTTTQINKLVDEFQECVGLSPIEARRSAFIALARANGWSNVRISRYLGVHRHRIGQKVEKYRTYLSDADKAEKMPTLGELMAQVTKNGADPSPGVVSFTQAAWEDESFARGMLDLAAGIEHQPVAG